MDEVHEQHVAEVYEQDVDVALFDKASDCCLSEFLNCLDLFLDDRLSIFLSAVVALFDRSTVSL
jgi:hypothetical protein